MPLVFTDKKQAERSRRKILLDKTTEVLNTVQETIEINDDEEEELDEKDMELVNIIAEMVSTFFNRLQLLIKTICCSLLILNKYDIYGE